MGILLKNDQNRIPSSGTDAGTYTENAEVTRYLKEKR
jgi:hypothetical protein